MEKDWIERMASFYREVDKAMDATCKGCGQCCHFDTAGHLLYASGLEKQYLLHIAAMPEQPDGDDDLIASGDRCPYQKDNKCHARSGRVLGCRLHFCQWPDVAAAEDAAEQWHARLKRLHEELGVEWRYARLLPLERKS